MEITAIPNQIWRYGKHGGKRLKDVPREILRWHIKNNHSLTIAERKEIKMFLSIPRKELNRGRPSPECMDLELTAFINRWHEKDESPQH